MNIVSLCWINFYKWTYPQCLSEIQERMEQKQTTLIVTPNPEMLYDASGDGSLMNILRKADYALPDGAGIFVAYQITQSTLPSFLRYILLSYWCVRAILHGNKLTHLYGERITGSRLTRDLLSYAEKIHTPVTIIDPIVKGNSSGDTAKRLSQGSMREHLQKYFPRGNITILVTDEVPEKLPDHGLVLATHGNGKQEKILSEILRKNPNCGIVIGIWWSIDLITGFRTPAPLFFQRFGGEWLYRFIKNPKRHMKRMKKVLSFLLSCFRK